ncbi:Anticodon-binding domain of tRNA, partial [Musa troglodytarum]
FQFTRIVPPPLPISLTCRLPKKSSSATSVTEGRSGVWIEDVLFPPPSQAGGPSCHRFFFDSFVLKSRLIAVTAYSMDPIEDQDLERKLKKEQKAKLKEEKKLKAAQKAEAAKLQAQRSSDGAKKSERKQRKRDVEEENPEDFMDPVTLVLPPPNVTGALHIGHGLTAAIQVWKWKNEYGGTILNQERRLGASLDWSREITPAHDPNDFEVGKRHNLDFINIFTDEGKININGGADFEGMPRFAARVAVIEALQAKGLYRGTQKNEMKLGICSRSNDVVEPMIKPQWFVDCKSMAKLSLDAVLSRDNKIIEIIPHQYEQEWKRWLENIRDWCISRQLWWGHRIPAWYVTLEDDQLKDMGSYNDHWVVGRNEQEAVLEAQKIFPGKNFEIAQDPDVYLHPMIRDAHGQKMSKSKGNVVDPLEVINGISLEGLHKRLEASNLDQNELERAKMDQIKDFPNGIPECGADALRFALVSYTAQSDKINLDVLRVVGYRQWCNKLWNAIRFAMTKLGDNYAPPKMLVVESMPSICQWILSVLNKAVAKTISSFESYKFSEATTAVYSWWQFQLCDVFIEAIKPYFMGSSQFESARKAARDTLWVCLDTGLRLLHPLMPFVTEELWQRLPQAEGTCRKESIMISEYPSVVEAWTNERIESDMEIVNGAVRKLRSLRPQSDKSERYPALALCRGHDVSNSIKAYELEILTLATVSSLKILTEDDSVPAGCAVDVVNENLSVYLQLQGTLNAEAEWEKLRKRREEAQKKHDLLSQEMNSLGYKEKAPLTIQEEQMKKLNSYLEELKIIDEAEQDLKRRIQGI